MAGPRAPGGVPAPAAGRPPLNYRHAFHAGNAADVLKHAALARILVHLREKPAAFRVLDTHAGAGFYDLAAAEAERGGEWRSGIGRLLASRLPEGAAALLAPYLDAVHAANAAAPAPGLQAGPGGPAMPAAASAGPEDGTAPAGALRVYPGSPALALALLRAQDRLIACETAPDIHGALAAALGGDRRAKALALDGWTALKAQLPPPERRGVVVIDPPFESAAEVTVLLRALAAAARKWPTGIFLVWYPLTRRSAAEVLLEGLRIAPLPKTLRAELRTAPAGPDARGLGASGIAVVNPPWRLEAELATLLPALAAALGGADGAFRLDWLRREGA